MNLNATSPGQLSTMLTDLERQREVLELRIQNIQLTLKLLKLERDHVASETETSVAPGPNTLHESEFLAEIKQWGAKHYAFIHLLELGHKFFESDKDSFLKLKVDNRRKGRTNIYVSKEDVNPQTVALLERLAQRCRETNKSCQITSGRILIITHN